MENFTKYLSENVISEDQLGFRLAKKITLVDGTVLSVQASEGHYCEPRKTIDYKDYNTFEIGFPSIVFKELLCYAEDSTTPTDTVYGYVPKEVIESIIVSCGGILNKGE